MAAIASTDVTVTPLMSSKRKIASRITEIEGTIAFGNAALTYASGGVPLPTTIGAFGVPQPLRQLELITDRNSTTGTHWYADVSTAASPVLHGWHAGYTPQIVVEEVPTLTGTTTKAGTLAYPPAYIISACATVSAAIVPLRILPTGGTAIAGSVLMNFVTGAFTSFAETPSVITFSYIPQKPAGPFAAANMVVDQAIAALTGNVTATQRMAAIQYLYRNTATKAYLPIGHANASGVVAVDINSTGDTVISFNSNENATSVLMTGLKYAGFQQPGVEWIDQATYTLTSEVIEFGVATYKKNGLYIPAFGNQIIVFHDGSTYDKAHLSGITGTPAAGLATYDLSTQILTTAETGDGETLTDLPMLFLSNLFTSPQGLSELTVNHAVASTTLRYIARF